MRSFLPTDHRPSSVDIGDDGEAVAAANAEAKAAFHLRLRARGVQDRAVLRAFELVPRRLFVPAAYLPIAARDLPLPIGCGQTLDAPWLVARMIEALALEPSHRVLEIGAGTGYATVIMAQLCASVMALERFQSLATAAQAKLTSLGVANAAVVWGDGLNMPAGIASFDRIIVHGVLDTLPPQLWRCLPSNGVLICARPAEQGQRIARIVLGEDGAVEETHVCPCRLQLLIPGVAATL